jgi:hypothetical protein
VVSHRGTSPRSTIAATRLAIHLKGFGGEEQAGSTPGKGCADATFTLKKALQSLREHGQESWVIFVDLVKAYDAVNREMLWKILKILGVPDNLIELLKKMYTDVTINLRVGEKLEQFLSTSGFKQGDDLVLILFIFVIHVVSNCSTRNGNSKTLTYDGTWILKLRNREGSYVEPDTRTREQSSRSSSLIMWTIRPSSFSAAENWSPPPSLSSLTFGVLG